MNAAQIKVLIAEDHPLMQKVMIEILQSIPDVHILGRAGTLSELADHFRRGDHNVLVLDVFLRNRCIFDLLRDHLSARPQVRALIISSHDPEPFARFSQKVGAHGFVGKHESPETFKAAFHAVAGGGCFWPASLAGPCAFSGREDRVKGLTMREIEVFQLIGKWRNTEEVAEELAISPKTVEIHRIHLKQKLGFASAMDLLHFAVEWVEMRRRPGPEHAVAP